MTETLLSTETNEDFAKARNKALFNEIQHFLNPEETTLISFSDIKKMLKPDNETYLGMKTVPVNQIVGSESRYQDFDNRFFPKKMHLKTRWEHIDMAHIRDINLPPITLYELGGVYFVRDGNHRVSVAKAKGVEFIDAEVVSLQSEIHLNPKDNIKKITRHVINYEKKVFYGETGFGDVTDFWGLDFSVPGQYDVIYNHILTHKYYINMNQTEEIPMDKAMVSWFTTVYLPVIKVIDRHHVMKYFKGRTKSDMYVYVIKYWDEMKMKFGNDFSLDDVADSFTLKFGTPLYKRIINRMQKIILKKEIENSLT